MAKPRKAKLKVFRTPVGFHDAYVAAPSQKAALEAWGSDSNLFAAGAAELVTDPELTREPLERPGEVVRKLRGTADEQVRALGTTKQKSSPSPRPSPAGGRGGRQEAGSRIKSGMTKKGAGGGGKKAKRGKRPSPAAVDKAEAALARAEERHRSAVAEVKAEERALDKRRRELERKQRSERERLVEAVETARERFRSAMEEWASRA